MKYETLQKIRIGGQPLDHGRMRTVSEKGGAVAEGVVYCGDRWFRIEKGILDVLPDDLSDSTRRAAFARRHGLEMPNSDAGGDATEGSEQKREQIEFFESDSVVYDDQVSHRSFYRASDAMFLQRWIAGIEPGSAVCDIGGGTGRQAIPLARKGVEVVSLDISEEMLLLGREKAAKENLDSRIDCILGDAEALPFDDAHFDVCICYGALHHFDNPLTVIRAAARCLKDGGRWYSYDPHKSSVRFLFDALMKLIPLYQEVARECPLFTKPQMEAWCEEAGLDVEVRRHFFLPPHPLAVLPPGIVRPLLEISDGLFNAVGAGGMGGIIAVEGRKRSVS